MMTTALARVVAQHGGAAASAWLRDTMARIAAKPEAMPLRVAIAQAARKLGDPRLDLGAELLAALPTGPAYATWLLRDFGRAALVLTACEAVGSEGQVALVEPLVRRGEQGEQISVLRMAALLPGPERFVPVFVDACRSNSRDVFEAIACDNPFVRDHFPLPSYNQVVLKALFMEVPVSRIPGLQQRASAELSRMAGDYGDERRAAGRSVPDDIECIQQLAKGNQS